MGDTSTQMTESYLGFRAVMVALLIALIGLFAASEIALLSGRNSRLRQMAEEGQKGAQIALNLLANPARLLSVTQVGVTLCSLALGWVGEQTAFQIVQSLFRPVLHPATAAMIHGVSLLLAFLAISYLHVVIGEVVPKNLAIATADRLAVMVAPVLLVFYPVSTAS